MFKHVNLITSFMNKSKKLKARPSNASHAEFEQKKTKLNAFITSQLQHALWSKVER